MRINQSSVSTIHPGPSSSNLPQVTAAGEHSSTSPSSFSNIRKTKSACTKHHSKLNIHTNTRFVELSKLPSTYPGNESSLSSESSTRNPSSEPSEDPPFSTAPSKNPSREESSLLVDQSSQPSKVPNEFVVPSRLSSELPIISIVPSTKPSEGEKQIIDGKPKSWNCDEVKTPSSGMPSTVTDTAPTLSLIPQPTNAKEQIRLQILSFEQQYESLWLLWYSVWASLYLTWIFFWSTLSSIDYYVIPCFQQILCTCSNFFISLFYCLLNFVGNNVKAEFFIYHLLLSVAIITIILIHTKYYTFPYSHHGHSRKRKPKSKPARPILSINHLAIYYIRRRRHYKRQIINFTGSIYFTGTSYIFNFTGYIISFTGSINFIGSVYTAYIMKHPLLRKPPGLNTRKLPLRNDSPVRYFNKITTALSFKQPNNLWKSSFPSSEEVSLSLGTFDILDHYHRFIDPFIITFQKHCALLPKISSDHRQILLNVSSP